MHLNFVSQRRFTESRVVGLQGHIRVPQNKHHRLPPWTKVVDGGMQWQEEAATTFNGGSYDFRQKQYQKHSGTHKTSIQHIHTHTTT